MTADPGTDPTPTPAPAPAPAAGPDEATVKGWVKDAIAEAGRGAPKVDDGPAAPITIKDIEEGAYNATQRAMRELHAAADAAPAPTKPTPKPEPEPAPVAESKWRKRLWG